MTKVRAHLLISGNVQGVFYRAFTEEVARSLGLAGWTRNMPDGSVETLFEGEREAIEGAIASCRIGSPAARVGEVKVKWEEHQGEFSSFTIRYY